MESGIVEAVHQGLKENSYVRHFVFGIRQNGNAIVVTGQVRTFYQKQMVNHSVGRILQKHGENFTLSNDIEVSAKGIRPKLASLQLREAGVGCAARRTRPHMTTQVIFPPRPKGKMNPTDLPDYEASGRWCAQRKFNGCRNLIHVTPEGTIEAFSRYGDTHKAFALTTDYVDQIRNGLHFQKGTEYWLDSEVMTKTTGAGGEIVFYDILQAGRYLFGRPNQMERLKMLRELCGDPQTLEPGGLALEISPKLWLAQTFTDDFVARFTEALDNDSIEGLVLRKKKSTLDHFGTEYYETGWVIRCRKPNKNYNH